MQSAMHSLNPIPAVDMSAFKVSLKYGLPVDFNVIERAIKRNTPRMVSGSRLRIVNMRLKVDMVCRHQVHFYIDHFISLKVNEEIFFKNED